MNRLFRRWLMWLLMLCIPLQGMAASTMALCGPQHAMAMSAPPVAPDVHAAHAGHQGHDHGATQVAAHDGADDHAATPASSSRKDASHAEDHKCSVCAACHSAAALMAGLPGLPAAEPAATVFAAVVLSVASFAADGPERPPRNVLA